MRSEIFSASVQYDDWTGTAAADSADQNDAQEWLVAKGYKEPGEYLVGVSVYVGENRGPHKDPVYVSFLLAPQGTHDDVKARITSSGEHLKVRKVQVEMKIADFFSLFKRFEVALSMHGMLDQRPFACVDEWRE